MDFDRKLIEAANRAEVSAILIRNGYRVYAPEADVDGVDLVLREKSGRILPVQQKGRPACHEKYRGQGITMLFPEPKSVPLRRSWYLILHDQLFNHAKSNYKSSDDFVGRHWPTMTKKLRDFLDQNGTCLVLPKVSDGQSDEMELST